MHAQKIGSGKRSQFLVMTKRIVASEDEGNLTKCWGNLAIDLDPILGEGEGKLMLLCAVTFPL